jgi:hypothetical protein
MVDRPSQPTDFYNKIGTFETRQGYTGSGQPTRSFEDKLRIDEAAVWSGPSRLQGW